MVAVNPRPNPYVGPRAFETGEVIYGRDRELQELLDLLIAERIVLLYSPSGAGKTSLIRAGLIPRLQQEGFHVLPPIRLNQELPQAVVSRVGEGDSSVQPDTLQSDGTNRYLLSALLSLEEGLPAEQRMELGQLTKLTLSEYLQARPEPTGVKEEPGGEPTQVLVFDQFEEVLTLDSTDQAGKAAFFAQLGATLRDRNRWALFSMREDYVGALDPYLRPIPTRLSNRFRLDLLSVTAAQQAIQQPVRTQGVEFSPKAVNKLVNDLRQIQVQRPDGSMDIRPGPYVEPVQLQVVCYHLWQRLPADKTEITEADLSAIGDVNQSLARYYATQVEAIATAASVKERVIRSWFEHELITESGIRSLVLMGVEQSKGLANSAIRLLENAHLIRAEKRLGATWFELAHDRLIGPVRSDNSAWFQQHLSLLQRQAGLWARQERPDTLLLRDEPLEEAERWAAAHPDELSAVDQEFLEACLEVRAREQQARAAEERERQLKLVAAQKIAEAQRLRAEEQARAAAKLRRRAYILAAVLILAVLIAGLAFINQQAATRNARVALEQRAAAQAASTLAYQNAATAQAAGELASKNALRAEANAAAAQAASTAAVAAQSTAEYNARVALEQEQIARQQASLARSRELASLAFSLLKKDSALTLLLSREALDISPTGQALDALLRGLQRNLSSTAEKFDQVIPKQEIDIYSLASSPDGRKIAWGGTDGLIRVWDLTAREQAWFKVVTPGKTVYAMTFSPDGTTLVTGDAAGVLSFWDAESGQRLRTLPTNIAEIYTLAYSPDGSTLAYAGKNLGTLPNLFSRNLKDDTITSFRIREGEVQESLSIAWSPDGRILASAGRDRIVHIWDAQTGMEIEQLKNRIVDNQLVRIFEGPVHRLAFSPNGKWLVTGGDDHESGAKDKTLMIWDTSAWADAEPLIFRGPEADLRALAFSPDGQTLVSGYTNGEVYIWNFNQQQATQVLKDHNRPVLALEFSQFDEALLLVSSGLDRLITLNNLIPLQTLFNPLSQGKGSSTRLGVNQDDTLAVVGNMNSSLRYWQLTLSSGEENEIDLNPLPVSNRYFLSPDGSQLAIVLEDGKIQVHDRNQNQDHLIEIPSMIVTEVDADGQTQQKQEQAAIDSLAFSPDGARLAGGTCAQLRRTTDPASQETLESCLSNDIYVWEIVTTELIHRFSSGKTSAILSLAFHPTEDEILATGFRDATIQLWNLTEERALGLPLVGLGGAVTSLAFHHDGDVLASGSANNLIALWNISPPQLIGDPLTGSDGSVTGLAFSRDSSVFYSGTDKGTLLRWDLEQWKEIACELAGRNLTQSEWEQFFPGETYRPTCNQYPLQTATATPAATPTANPLGTPTASP